MVVTRRQRFIQAAGELARARVQFSEAFIMYRSTGGDKMTDRQAEAMAIIKTEDAITVKQAELEAARRDFNAESK